MVLRARADQALLGDRDFGADPAQGAMLPLGAAVVVGVVWAQRSRYRPRP